MRNTHTSLNRFFNVMVLAAFMSMLTLSCATQMDTARKKMSKVGESLSFSPSSLAGQSAEDHFARGEQHISQGQIWQAISEWEKAVEADPKHSLAHFQLGLAYKKLGDVAQRGDDLEIAGQAYMRAISHYDAVIKLTPDDSSVYNNIANVYYAIQNYNKAIQSYHKAIIIKPYDPDYHYNIANAFSKKKDMSEQAAEHYLEAIRLNPDYYDAYYNLANLFEKMGDKKNAAKYYQEYAERESRQSEAEWVQKALEKVQQLRGGVIY